MYKYILFDLDGTLTDSAPGIIRCVQYALEKCGKGTCPDRELLPFIGPPLTESFQKIGVRVPEDVALTGFDDDEDRMLYPFFSTVHVDTKWLGRRMVHEFLWREEHPEAPKERILVSGEVVVRRSSCKRQG